MIGYDKVYCWEESRKKFNTFEDPSYRRPPRAMSHIHLIGDPQIFIGDPKSFYHPRPKLLRNTKLIIGEPRISSKNPISFIWTHRFWLETQSCSSETPDFHWRAIEGITGGPVIPAPPCQIAPLKCTPKA